MSSSVCEFCAKPGHITDKCFLKRAIEKRENVKRCNTGITSMPNNIKIDGSDYFGIIDTGPNVLLMKKRYICPL